MGAGKQQALNQKEELLLHGKNSDKEIKTLVDNSGIPEYYSNTPDKEYVGAQTNQMIFTQQIIIDYYYNDRK